jgi:hypothetical protein
MLTLCKFPEVFGRYKKFIIGNFIQPLRNWNLACPVSKRDLSIRFRYVSGFRY